jgi:hypothetical protein
VAITAPCFEDTSRLATSAFPGNCHHVNFRRSSAWVSPWARQPGGLRNVGGGGSWRFAHGDLDLDVLEERATNAHRAQTPSKSQQSVLFSGPPGGRC